MTEQAKIRRLKDTLTIAGTAAVAFSVWSLAKIGLFLSLAGEDTLSLLFRLIGIDTNSLAFAVYASLGATALIDLGVRAYVGLSARAEGRDKKPFPFYLLVAVIVALLNASSLFAIALGAPFEMSLLGMIVSITIEATALAALVLVIYSAMRLRQMRKTAID